jgi:hypothetical protein
MTDTEMKKSNLKNKIINCFIFCLTTLTYLQSLQAQEFIIGVEDIYYYPLFEFKSDRETHSRELLDSFAASKGYKFTYLPLPIKRFEKWLIEDKIDFKYPDNPRWYADDSTSRKLTFSQSSVWLIAGTSVLKSSLKKDKPELKSVGTLLGFYPTTWIDEIKSGQIKLYEDASTKMLVQQLIMGHIDSIDIEPSVINYYLEELGKPSDTIVIDTSYKYDIYGFHLSTIKHPNIIKEFDDYLKNNKVLLEQLNKKYQITDYRPYLK